MDSVVLTYYFDPYTNMLNGVLYNGGFWKYIYKVDNDFDFFLQNKKEVLSEVHDKTIMRLTAKEFDEMVFYIKDYKATYMDGYSSVLVTYDELSSLMRDVKLKSIGI